MILIKAKNVLFLDLYDLQRAGVMVDTRLILDDGELSIHWLMLDLYGYEQWWSGLGEAGGDNVIILPGVSLAEAQEFVDHLYGRDIIVSDRHFTVREDTEVADNFVCNNNSDCEDVNEPVGFMLKFKNKK